MKKRHVRKWWIKEKRVRKGLSRAEDLSEVYYRDERKTSE